MFMKRKTIADLMGTIALLLGVSPNFQYASDDYDVATNSFYVEMLV